MRKILIIGLIFILIGGVFCGAAYATGEKYVDSKTTDISTSLAVGGVDNLNIGAHVANIIICKSEKNSGEILVTAENVMGEEFICRQSDNTLNISYNPNSVKIGFLSLPKFAFEPFWSRKSPVIRISIPDGTLFETVYFEGGLGDTEIEQIQAKSFVINGGVGNYNFKSIYAESFTIDGGLGNVKISGIIEGDIKVDGGVGNIRMNLTGEADDYNIKANSGIGNIRINGKSPSWGENWGRGKYNIIIDGGLGDVNININ